MSVKNERSSPLAQSQGPAELMEDRQYRALAPLAVVALLAALASFSAFVTPVLLVVPVAGVLLGAAALWRISREPLRYSGGGLATFAVMVSAFVLVFCLTRSVLHQRFMVSTGLKHAREWLDLVRTSKSDPTALFKAHQLTLAYSFRQPEGVNLVEHYAEPAESAPVMMSPTSRETIPVREFERFFNDQMVAELARALQGDAKYEYLGLGPARVIGDKHEQQAFHFEITDPADQKKHRFAVVMRRSRYPDVTAAQWAVDAITPIGSRLPTPFDP